MKIKLILFILFLLQTLYFKAQNLVVNGGFEDGTNGWIMDFSGSAASSMEVADAQEGRKVLNVNSATQNGSIVQKISGIIPGEMYRFSFGYKFYNELPGSGKGVRMRVEWYDEYGSSTQADEWYVQGEIEEGFANIWLDYFPIEAVAHTVLSWGDGSDGIGQPISQAKIFIAIDRNSSIYIDDVQAVKVSDVITGLSAVKAELPVRSENGNLVVSGAPAGSRIDVYSLVGNRLQSAVAAQGETVIPNLPKGQVLIVRSGNEAAKVAL